MECNCNFVLLQGRVAMLLNKVWLNSLSHGYYVSLNGQNCTLGKQEKQEEKNSIYEATKEWESPHVFAESISKLSCNKN